MTAYTRPLLIESSTGASLLERIPFGGNNEKAFEERWLQRALFRFPECLPVREIDAHIGSLIPVCMELQTGSGPADILYVTPTGQVVLVETKLWRNPEARRAVVGQILDYAKQLTSWTYDVLDQNCSRAANQRPGHLLTCLRQHAPDADEAQFVDGVHRSLASGDFLLLIIGDGIQAGAESLVSFLERFGHMRFGLGLIEVAAFRTPDGKTLLQPRILAKTEVIERTILVGPQGAVPVQVASQLEDQSERTNPTRQLQQKFWEDFVKAITELDPSTEPGPPAKGANQYFPMPPSASSMWISPYLSLSTGKAGVYLGTSKNFEQRYMLIDYLESDKEAIERELGFELVRSESYDDRPSLSGPSLPLTDIADPSARQALVLALAKRTAAMIKVLRPRLQASVNQLKQSGQLR
jgi:hypothetical protein